ncbi:MAG: hypothetical protein FWE35_23115 [Streptosporangiales bacterium]|nr:hypothetical protein [Streptosporangiales bacterium]
MRQRRPRRAWTLAAVIASAAVAVAVAVLATREDTPPGHSTPPPPVPDVSYTVTVNGQAQRAHIYGPVPRFAVSMGEKLTVIVSVTSRETISKLWIGIDDGIQSSGPGGTPVMHPVLAADTRMPRSPGIRRLRFRWDMPSSLGPTASRQLAIGWAWPGQTGFPEPGISQRTLAELHVRGRPNP